MVSKNLVMFETCSDQRKWSIERLCLGIPGKSMKLTSGFNYQYLYHSSFSLFLILFGAKNENEAKHIRAVNSREKYSSAILNLPRGRA